DLQVQCLSLHDALPIYQVTVTDHCGAVTKRHIGDSIETNGCSLVISRTYEAADVCGNVTPWIQRITVRDRTPPVIIGPADLKARSEEHMSDLQSRSDTV